jgi:hypothetical protein
MASPFLWPVLVPYAPSVLRRRLPWALGPRVNAPLTQAKRATSSVAKGSQACASWFAQGLVACLHSSWRQHSNQHTGTHAHAVACHHRPNWSVKGTPTTACTSAAPNGRPLLLALGPRVNAPRAQAKRATSSVATSSQACASWFAQGLMACLHSSWQACASWFAQGLVACLHPSWRQHSNQHTGVSCQISRMPPSA